MQLIVLVVFIILPDPLIHELAYCPSPSHAPMESMGNRELSCVVHAVVSPAILLGPQSALCFELLLAMG